MIMKGHDVEGFWADLSALSKDVGFIQFAFPHMPGSHPILNQLKAVILALAVLDDRTSDRYGIWWRLEIQATASYASVSSMFSSLELTDSIALSLLANRQTCLCLVAMFPERPDLMSPTNHRWFCHGPSLCDFGANLGKLAMAASAQLDTMAYPLSGSSFGFDPPCQRSSDSLRFRPLWASIATRLCLSGCGPGVVDDSIWNFVISARECLLDFSNRANILCVRACTLFLEPAFHGLDCPMSDMKDGKRCWARSDSHEQKNIDSSWDFDTSISRKFSRLSGSLFEKRN
jgi:hypothetical protein